MSANAREPLLSDELLGLEATQEAFRSATQSGFLQRAGQGKLGKATLEAYLAQDRLYALGYRACVGDTLARALPAAPDFARKPELRRLLRFSLENIEREIGWFESLGRDWDLDVRPEYRVGRDGNEVTKRYTALFEDVGKGKRDSKERGNEEKGDEGEDGEDTKESATGGPGLGLLDCLILLWATEYVYLEAWSFAAQVAKSEVSAGHLADLSKDEDGGVCRKELIPNWTSQDFKGFVDSLKDHLDSYVDVVTAGSVTRGDVSARAVAMWRAVLELEAAFWPQAD